MRSRQSINARPFGGDSHAPLSPHLGCRHRAACCRRDPASTAQPRCREFNVTVLANNPNHVFLYEVYDNEAALTAHRAGEHFKKFQAATANMVTGRNVRAMSLVAFNSKGH